MGKEMFWGKRRPSARREETEQPQGRDMLALPWIHERLSQGGEIQQNAVVIGKKIGI